ncbi:MAG: site-specific integrase [Defluviicoccus sp.]|nr:MAG: site-specific integrase [Defluviicoccus sp.]
MAKQAKVLTDADVKRVLAVIAQDRHAARNRAVLMLSLLGGFRAVELAALTIGSVLDGQGQIADRITLAKNQTKGHEARSVPISRRMWKELESYLGSLHRLDPQRPLFASQKGGGFSAHGITLLLKRMFDAAGVSGASSHSGRRTFATKLAERGVGIRVIQRLMGHSSIQTTAAYVEAGEHQQVAAVELL